MWWNLNDNWVSWFWLFNITKWEMSVMLSEIKILSKFINTLDIEYSTVSNEWPLEFNFITGEISITNKLLAWLVDSKSFW